jgi:hypothetical protein
VVCVGDHPCICTLVFVPCFACCHRLTSSWVSLLLAWLTWSMISCGQRSLFVSFSRRTRWLCRLDECWALQLSIMFYILPCLQTFEFHTYSIITSCSYHVYLFPLYVPSSRSASRTFYMLFFLFVVVTVRVDMSVTLMIQNIILF